MNPAASTSARARARIAAAAETTFAIRGCSTLEYDAQGKTTRQRDFRNPAPFAGVGSAREA